MKLKIKQQQSISWPIFYRLTSNWSKGDTIAAILSLISLITYAEVCDESRDNVIAVWEHVDGQHAEQIAHKTNSRPTHLDDASTMKIQEENLEHSIH